MYATGSPSSRRPIQPRYSAAGPSPTSASCWAMTNVRSWCRAWPRSSSASSRAVSEPDARSLSVPSLRSSPTVAIGFRVPVGSSGRRAAVGEGAEAVGLVRGDERVDQSIELAIQDARQIREVRMDAVVGHPILREVVGPDLVRSVAGADQRLPGSRVLLALPAPLGFLEPRTKHGHRLGLVLVLALLVLDLDDGAGREVGDPHGRVGRVDRLATGARG